MPKICKQKLYNSIKEQLQTLRKIEESELQTLPDDIYWDTCYIYLVHVHKETW